ncbi:uncharacterized protein LOC113019453 isoform X1 [Astatotilapia calliptera]|nr:uncharacterized protein LOC113019453 isoform X1 [Astatotilapia calliptera]
MSDSMMMTMVQSWDSEPDIANMSKSDILRGIITDKLSTAAREILSVVERTVADYEEEAAGFRQELDRQRRLLELLQPEIKQEADDQQLFSICEDGGGPLLDDQKQDKYELRVDDSSSLGFQAPIEDEEYEYLEQEEGYTTELDYVTTSRFLTQTVPSKRRKKHGKRRISKSQNCIDLKIRILENPNIEVLSNTVFRMYRLHKLKVRRGLKEADFLKLLRSTFPQLAGDEPFDLFLYCNLKKLKPLQVDSVTPEEIIRVSRGSTLYIRLQKEDADEDHEDLPSTETDTHINLRIRILEKRKINVLSKQVFQTCPLHKLKVHRGLQEADFLKLLRSTFPQLAGDEPFDLFLRAKHNKLKPLKGDSVTPEEIIRLSRGSTLYIQQSLCQEDLRLKIRILEDPKIDKITNIMCQNHPSHELNVPRGLQEADFLALLRSTFPQLAAGEPFTILIGRNHNLIPPRVESMTAEEICKNGTGNPGIYIRLKGPEKRSLQREDATAAELPPPSLDSTTLTTEVESEKPQISQSDTHVHLKVHNVEDPQMDTISPNRVDDSRSLGFQAPIEDEEYEYLEQEEGYTTELDYVTTSRFLTQTVPSKRRKKHGKRRISKSQNCIDLKIRILENPNIEVLSNTVFRMYRLHKLKVRRGLKEADFLKLLRSTFPQLAGDEPFDLFLYCNLKKLKPLQVDSVTPEEIIRVSRGSTLYIRLQKEDADEDHEDLPSTETDTHINLRIRILEKRKINVLSKQVFQTCPLHKLKVHRGLQEADFLKLLRSTFPQLAGDEPFDLFLRAKHNKLKPLKGDSVTPEEIIRLSRGSTLYIQQSLCPEDLRLKIRILEDPKIDKITNIMCQNHPSHELNVPRGLQEADFLALLRSTFPQLAAGEPFTILIGRNHDLIPPRVESMTAEEICKNRTRNPGIYIRLKGPEKRSLQREDATAAELPPPSLDSTTLTTEVESEKPQISQSDTHVHLKVHIVEDPQMDTISPNLFQNYLPHELQVPRGLQEADFLAQLRSTFPQLAAAEPLELLISNDDKILELLNMESLTTEEIKEAVQSTGSATLFVRLKASEDVQDDVNKLDGAEDSSSFSEQTTLHRSNERKPLDEDLKDIILRALPLISEDTQQSLIHKLLSDGVESTQDLKFVIEDDIADLLPPLQLQTLLEAFKNETDLVTLDLPVIPSSSSLLSSPAASPCSTSSGVLPLSNQEHDNSESCGQTTLFRKHWAETFQVPWDLMPMEIQAAVAEGKRPSPAARRQMVRILADEMRKHELNPTRAQCVTICRNIVRKYPQSFADLCDNGQLLEEDYISLVIQIKNRIDNLKRTSNFRHSRLSGMKRGSTNNYGCARFEPGLLPEETNETVERKRQRLEEIYHQDGSSMVEKDEVKELMKVTFYLQRRQINALPVPAIRDLRGRWPYLFTHNGLYTHFELLTDIKVLRTLEVAMEECGPTILEVFSKSTNPDIQSILSVGPKLELSFCILQLLMAHFSEPLGGLILFANANATAAELQTTLQLPPTPRLILLAESPKSSIRRWMISLEGHIICEGIQPTFLSGLAAVFSTYYIFNLQYQDDAACTLEFIQRRLIGINPDTGTKVPQGKFPSKETGKFTQEKTSPVNPQVLKLLKKLMDVNPAVYTHTTMFPSLQGTSN